MTECYRDYVWRDGCPVGKIRCVLDAEGICYKIITGPYHKRISIEKYQDGVFQDTLYDSILLDFRRLKGGEPPEWERVLLSEKEGEMRILIRDQEDRALFIEVHQFQEGICRQCSLLSIHGVFLSLHRFLCADLGDPFDGVQLMDREQKIVMRKKYLLDPTTREFTQLLAEYWV